MIYSGKRLEEVHPKVNFLFCAQKAKCWRRIFVPIIYITTSYCLPMCKANGRVANRSRFTIFPGL